MIDDLPEVAVVSATASPAETWFDATTGVPGPAFWRTVLAAESARCRRYRCPATVVLAQVVGLDALARLRGPEAALLAMADVVAVLRAGCRSSDYVARLRDDRVGMILTETDEIAAINMIERVRDQCDRVLRNPGPGARIAFGWASPTIVTSLANSVGRAADLLREEAAADRPE